MTDNRTNKTVPTEPADKGKWGEGNSKKRSRLLAGIILVAYGLYHCFVQYYSAVDHHLLAKSWSGIAALALYESGKYEKASRYWRRHYGLVYNPATAAAYGKTLQDRIQKEPDKTEAYYLLADLSFSQGNYAEAASIYQEVLTRHKADYGASLGLATCLAMEGDYKKSRIVFSRLFRYDNKEDNVTGFLHALVLLDRLEQAKEPGSTDTYLMLAYVNRYLRIVDARREKGVFLNADKALELDRKLDEAYLCEGVMYMKRGEYDQALDLFGRAAEVNPGNADAFNRMGYIYGRLGALEQELASYRKAVELDDDPIFASRLGDLLLKKYGDARQAGYYFKKALDRAPDDYEIISRYGYDLLLTKEYDKLLGVCAMMIGRYPKRPYGYKLKGDCFMATKEYGEAVACYLKSNEVAREAKEGSQLDFSAFVDLGLAYEKLKRLDDAIAAYRQALKFKPHDVETLYSLQFVCRSKGKYNEAYEAVKEILRLQPNHSGAQRLLPYLQRNAAGSSL